MSSASGQDDASERSMFATPEAAPFIAIPKLDPSPPDTKRIAVAGKGQAVRSRLPWATSLRALRGHATLPGRVQLSQAIRLDFATDLDRGAGFILTPVFLAIGAVVYFSLTAEPGLSPVVAGLVCLGAAFACTRSRPAINLALAACLLVVAGIGFAKLETWRAGTNMLGGEISTQLTARVAAIEHMATGRVRLTLDVIATARPVLRYVPDRVRVSTRAIPAGVVAGSTVTGIVRMMPPSGPVRPDSYDFSFESYFDGIGASGFFLRGPELAAEVRPATSMETFRASVERARDDIAKRIRDRIGGSEGEIAAALVVGVRAGIPEDVNEALRRAGIYHIISISGLHMALVAGTIMGLLRAGFALFPDLASRRPVKKYAAALAIVGLAAYLFISGGEVAAQRSFVMLAIMLVAVLFDRAAVTMRNLALSAIVVIAVSPHEVMGPSFQMSFAATAALVGAYAAWSDHRAGRPSQAPTNRGFAGRIFHAGYMGMAGLAMTSIVAGGATAIYSAYHFQQMPSLGLLTNLVAMPIVSILVMPFAVFGMLAMPFGLDGPFFDVMGAGLAATIAVARWFSERSPIDAVGLISPWAVALFTMALAIAAVCTTRLRAVSLPLALASLVLLARGAAPPDILVSEDGRLVGVSSGDGKIAVNRARPNEFTLENWRRAMHAENLVKPTKTAGDLADREGGGLTKPGREAEEQEDVANGLSDVANGQAEEPVLAAGAIRIPELLKQVGQQPGFVCADDICLTRHPSGALVAHTPDANSAAALCHHASVIVIDDATAKNVCRNAKVLVITKRDVARRGAAAIRLSPKPSDAVNAKTAAADGETAKPENQPLPMAWTATLDYAIRMPYRPWHAQRKFSREARGVAAYVRAAPKPAPSTNQPPASSEPTAAAQPEAPKVSVEPAPVLKDDAQ